MYSHNMVGSNDIEASKKFYDATFQAIGGKPAITDDKGRLIYMHNGGLFLVGTPIDGEPASIGNGCTIGFAMENPEQANAWHEAGVAAIGSKRVSFGKAEDMERLLGIAPGSVTPLAAINAAPGSIAVVLDAGLAAAETVNVHPLRNTGTLGLAGATILDLLRHWGHRPLVAAIPVQEPA